MGELVTAATTTALASQDARPMRLANVRRVELPLAAVRRAVTRTAVAELCALPTSTEKVFVVESHVPNSISLFRSNTRGWPSTSFADAIAMAWSCAEVTPPESDDAAA